MNQQKNKCHGDRERQNDISHVIMLSVWRLSSSMLVLDERDKTPFHLGT